MEAELGICPFCASSISSVARIEMTLHYEYHVKCENCGASGPINLSVPDAMKSWNTRREEPLNDTERFDW
jgi:Lar family restriction alleviation protein